MTHREASVLVVDDDAIVREWVRASLSGTEFRIAGEAAALENALDLVRRRRPDIIVVDYRLPDRVGLDLVRETRRRYPGTRALLITANPERGLNEAAREAGADGSVVKTGSRNELLDALRALVEGKPSFDVRHPRAAMGERRLTPREREVLRLVAAGATNREAATALGVSDQTIKTLIGRAYSKLGVHRRAEAVALAQSRGLI
jgi:DNA-binding NarL/FixJ family response regulator